MIAMIVTSLVGILLCVLGGVNMSGNISSLHSYHRARVNEEDKKKFGKIVGIGNIIIGVSIIAYGILQYIYERTQVFSYFLTGIICMIVGMIVGLGICFFGMIKYNKGIFWIKKYRFTVSNIKQ